MFKREMASTLDRYLRGFPAVMIGGSRQVGKTTFVRAMLGEKYEYVLLENPDVRNLATQDPKRFLERYKAPVILDEFQSVPILVNYLQGLIDSNRDLKGQYVLTGSQNYLMMEQVSQSLAGRIGVLTLYGLASSELSDSTLNPHDEALGNLLLRGSFPELWATLTISAQDWFGSYVQTYLERDVRRLVNIGDLSTFERFLKATAARTGQNLNLSELASDCGTSPNTVERWISILEATYLIRRLPPFYANLTSRIKKSSKLYFMDTGLAAYLMGFRDVASLLGSPQYGALFETLVVTDLIKRRTSKGEHFTPYYLQSTSMVGADLVLDENQQLTFIEIKGSKTLIPSLGESLAKTAKVFQGRVKSCVLAMPLEQKTSFEFDGVTINAVPWNEVQ